jgi:glutathione reductase (NADPH)
MKTNRYDVAVIGTGTAASQIAFGCREAGKSVVVIDSRPFGGTCALRGCDPKKVLVGAADLADWARRMKGLGIEGDAQIDWPALMRFKRTFTEPVPQRREKSFLAKGIDALHGRARFTAPDRLAIAGDEITAGQIAIAAGMRPATLHVPGEELLITSDRFLDLDQLPPRVLFVGGGYIAFEFGHLAARAGAKVTIIDRGDRPLPAFDPDLADQLLKNMRATGIDVHLNSAVTRVESNAIYTESAKYEGDLLVHAAGRVPDLDDMELARGQVEADAHGVKVDEYLQSASNPGVFAAGDCANTGNPALTPVAGYEGRIAAANMISPRSRKADEHLMPSIVFSIPPLARVGFSEDQAARKGVKYRAIYRDASQWYSARRIAEPCAGSKVLIEEGSGRILGAHLLGTGSEEVINFFCLAMRTGTTASQLRNMVFGYPTRSSDVPYMVEEA